MGKDLVRRNTRSVEENRDEECELRQTFNRKFFNDKFYILRNPDPKRIPKFVWAFSKALPHNCEGIVDPEQMKLLIKGVRFNPKYINQIKLGGELGLVNPSSVWDLAAAGPYKSNSFLEPPPSFQSRQTGNEMIELYGMALVRDLPFHEYPTNSDIDLITQNLSQNGPLTITYRNIFRGMGQGDLIGPHVSQFLYLPYESGIQHVEQKYLFYQPGVNYMTTLDSAIKLQNGIVTEGPNQRTVSRYMLTLRDGATFVHLDDNLQDGLIALYVLRGIKAPISKGIPKDMVEDNFINYGSPDINEVLATASRAALLAAWYIKWSYLRVRPEAYSIQVELAKMGENKYGIPDILLDSPVLAKCFQTFGTHLLPQAYPEGSPCHPAYPAGHSAFIGALITILKAFYDEDYEFDGVQPNADGSQLLPLGMKLKVGHELNKLASNIALFRNGAGVHYRSDALGILLGEHIAIQILQERVQTYPFKTVFQFHTYEGKRVVISN